ncbi:MAG: alpha/beta hydrolase [Candidatus Endonucleobacter sp. (ex Gigantidas childressi)]|nr:alpha/beta hydrolase [Candidatus Endonucleobacter sp. (ex Gigantidas childressi)]
MAKKSYHQASQFYSIASYPHLKTDELSIQAQLLAFSNYRKSFEHNKNTLLKEIKVPCKGKEIIYYLHLPDDHDIHSIVIVTGG